MYGHPQQSPPILQAPVPQYSTQRIINSGSNAAPSSASSQHPNQQQQYGSGTSFQQQQFHQPYAMSGSSGQSAPHVQQQSVYPANMGGFQQQQQQQFQPQFQQQFQQPQFQQQQNNPVYASQYPSASTNSMSASMSGGASGSQPQVAGPTAATSQSYLGSNFVNDFQGSAAGQIGMQLGTQAFAQVQQNINRYVNVTQLRYYFNVSNSYVLNKVRLLLFPYRHKSWSRLVRRSEHSGQAEGFAPPREDLNAPDLYLPVMSYVTYVLLVGLSIGVASDGSVVSKKFTPEVLGSSATGAFFIVFCEVLLLKLAFYFLSVVNDASFLDLISYCGYKFIFVCILVVFKSMLGMLDWRFWIPGAYLILSFGFFTLRTLRYLVIPDQSTNSVVGRDGRKRRVLGLFLICAFQCVSMLALI
ncbi:hypothetical protein BDEG_20296 [Batrachochytrium dendrobatidis JEL423]|uniref:YIF1-domain-containing protein n=1 Tax=Batrachochytrium dendrobatidis (strain JEL423) TaxID=403673 RepID=A0A177W8U6_BATDL|nr:hypothetical protein BDEG_20296 [Batrachochytrium dendrobatidis JEL423]